MSGGIAKAFAPATVANVAVGFDLLGFPICSLGDEVTVKRVSQPGVRLESIVTMDGSDIPLRPEVNTATVPLLRMIEELNLPFGFQVSIKKGIPLGSGLGGSAASAVAAVKAASAVLDRPLNESQLIDFALEGEAVASGARHGDNVVPCFLGGMRLVRSVGIFGEGIDTCSIPVPKEVICVVVHPHLKINTKEARGILKEEVKLKDHVRQSSNLGGLIVGCFREDYRLIRESLSDVLIEPQRARLIPGFFEAKKAALSLGVLGFSISGSGPTVFAWVRSDDAAKKVSAAVVESFRRSGLEADSWISPVSVEGARVLGGE